ncbi:hypothetical protein [Leptolyngbya sp. FACHB-261]|uniref:hypothetical protein n=1 Tax=Leptolyngbya sp. FACHB-261 TaxID=2692806 RepID=UPI0016880B94|nr:hypothetical protein [Leptolyngbya sp. FACHB-261]MBD2101340.1 hypothetical protein [Leptolyngbya sp. FACHB-261]
MTQSKRRRFRPNFATAQRTIDPVSSDSSQPLHTTASFDHLITKPSARPSFVDQASPEKNFEKGSPQHNGLPQLIEQDAPLQSRSQLIMMYDRFQAEMPIQGSLGVGSWIRQFLQEHGLPSLIRFGQSNRLRVFRRDEFQPWFEPLMVTKP